VASGAPTLSAHVCMHCHHAINTPRIVSMPRPLKLALKRQAVMVACARNCSAARAADCSDEDLATAEYVMGQLAKGLDAYPPKKGEVELAHDPAAAGAKALAPPAPAAAAAAPSNPMGQVTRLAAASSTR
jgi:hypothetical protein